MIQQLITTFLILSLCALNQIKAQNTENETLSPTSQQDVALWTGVDLGHKIHSKLKGNLVVQTRFDENVSSFHSLVAEQKVAFSLHKSISFYGKYRLVFAPDVPFAQRWTTGIQAKHKVKNLVLGLRSQVQHQWQKDNDTHNAFRNLFSLTYQNPDNLFQPYIYTEWFYAFNKQVQQFSRYRWGVGTKYQINDQQTLNAKYFFQSKLHVETPEIDHIFMLIYGIKL